MTSNYSFYAIPAAWVLAMAPHVYASSLSKSFDNRSPRTYTKLIEKDQTIDEATRGRITRAEGAQQNGFENLSFFAAGVVAGNLAGIAPSTLNALSGGYLASRVVYNLLYIHVTSEPLSYVRSLTWIVGVGQIFALYIKAGNILKDRAANLL